MSVPLEVSPSLPNPSFYVRWRPRSSDDHIPTEDVVKSSLAAYECSTSIALTEITFMNNTSHKIQDLYVKFPNEEAARMAISKLETNDTWHLTALTAANVLLLVWIFLCVSPPPLSSMLSEAAVSPSPIVPSAAVFAIQTYRGNTRCIRLDVPALFNKDIFRVKVSQHDIEEPLTKEQAAEIEALVEAIDSKASIIWQTQAPFRKLVEGRLSELPSPGPENRS